MRGARGETVDVEGTVARWLAIALDWCIEAALWVLAAPWFVLGWLCGALVWLIVFIASAVVAGFRAAYQVERVEER